MVDRTDIGNEKGHFIGTDDKSLYERIGLWLAAGDWRYGKDSDANWYGGY